jgi:integrase
MRSQPVFSDPKTPKSRRSIPITAEVVAVLRRRRAEQAALQLLLGPEYNDHDLVASQPDGRPYVPNIFSQRFRTIVRKNHLKPIRFHDLRHTWATLARGSAVSVQTASEMLGRSSIVITADTYTHVVEAQHREAADQ